jgi:hypothetical protein
VQASTQETTPLRERIAERGRSRRGAPDPAQEDARVAAVEPGVPAANVATPAVEAKQPSLVAAPMPIARPRDLALPEASPETLQTASLPAASDAAGARLIAAPMPPSRPAAVNTPMIEAQALASPEAVRSIDQGENTLPTGRLVAMLHPAPPQRPNSVANPGQASADKPAITPAVRSGAAQASQDPERAALDLLFAGAARTTSVTPAKIVTAKARQIVSTSNSVIPGNAPAAAFGFSRGKATDMSTERFSGQAVKPLPSNFIQQ